MHNCPLCGKPKPHSIFKQNSAPAFQNKTYVTEKEAEKALTASMDLVQCDYCRFVWNQAFNPTVMEYDEQYQNEQGHSSFFQTHLESVLNIIKTHAAPGDRLVEVGCGKAKFLSMLRDNGYQITGFDPAYEGADPDVVCEYFDISLNFPPANMIVLRHTLEHIPNPLQFLHAIKEANGGSGKIYIEVPCFNWIVQKKAFWDIFHEHCNYFTIDSLSSMFQDCVTDSIFGDQYLYLVGDLSTLRKTANSTPTYQHVDAKCFTDEISRLKKFVAQRERCLIWGAGAKGAAFALLTDPFREFIEAVIDINPKKQKRYLGKTGHPILGFECLNRFLGSDVIIMNENYRNEIEQIITDFNVNLYTLGDI